MAPQDTQHHPQNDHVIPIEKRKRDDDDDRSLHPMWKTSLCSYFRSHNGSCSHSDACRYAHGEEELRLRLDNRWDPTFERAKKYLKSETGEKHAVVEMLGAFAAKMVVREFEEFSQPRGRRTNEEFINGFRRKINWQQENKGKVTVGFMLGNFKEGVTVVEEAMDCPNVINLLHNKLSGNVPSWFGIGSMSQLTKLLLGANDLVGTTPHSLGNLSSLQNVTLARNHLEGSIPDALGRLSNLKELNLGLNNLSVVPVSLYNLLNIQIFVLGENQLSGTLPSNMHLAFPNLRVFFVGWNNFYGIFPSSIPNITGLQALDISLNGFSGSIPPTLGSLNKLTRFSIAYNSFGSGRAQDLDFLSSLSNCTQLRILLVGNNEFGGVLPDLIGNFSTHLT
ncbi:putative LRR receptor-like serine/threonine-protein kinase, partial [Mucuna pruriens]